jgi:glycerol-3-phosphate dehydrogenase
MDTTVLVIGGGATGAGVARDLAMRGVDVTLVERGRFAGGTSGRSHGLLHSGARYAVDDSEGAADCLVENRILKRIAPHCIADTGGYFLRTADDDPQYFQRKREACEEVGIEATVVDPEEARREVPDLADGVEGVLEVPDAVVHPTRLTAANAADAREHGARLLPETEVRDVVRDGDRVVGVRVDDGSDEYGIDAEHVVNATGAWAGRLGALAGVEVEMAPTSGVMVAVEFEGLDTVLNRARPAADGDIVVPHDEQVVLGTTSVDVEDPDEFSTDDAEIDRMFEECGAMLAGLDRDRIDRVYWGVRPLYTEDRERYEGRQISRGFYLLDHEARDGVAGLSTIVGGKLTTYRRMAEAVGDHVADRLDVEEASRTADVALVGHDDPGRIDAIVREFGASNPADEDLIAPGDESENE